MVKEMDTNSQDIVYLRGLVSRRKYYFLLPFILIAFLTFAMALMLPSIYNSKATILIEAQNIPEEMVRTTVTGFVEERLQSLTQIVLSRANLEEIVNRLNLYPELREKNTIEQIVVKMKNNIEMAPIQAQVANPRGGRSTAATIAFNISYEGKDPEQTAGVTSALVSLYLEQNLKVREEKAAGTVNFFRQQLDEIRKEMDIREEEIARFKEKHLHSLPELMQFNMQIVERTRNELDTRQKDLDTLMNRLIYLQGQLAGIEPVRYRGGDNGRGATLEEELRFLNNQYLTHKAVKAENHPDIIRLKNQIDSLDKEAYSRQSMRDMAVNLESKQNQLVSLRQRYSDSHPDVIALSREIDILKDQLEERSLNRALFTEVESIEPENPAFINIQTQIASTKLEIDNARAKIRDLERAYAQYQRRVENSPAVEQQFKLLQRDHLSLQQSYQETTSRLQAAVEAMELEEGQMAEKLIVIEPPQIPEIPVKPNRKAILILGLVFASGLGVGSTAMAEYFDSSVRDSQNLAKISGSPVLGSIPYLRTRQDKIKAWIKVLVWILVLTVLAGGMLALIHYYYSPLDILWIDILNKIET